MSITLSSLHSSPSYSLHISLIIFSLLGREAYLLCREQQRLGQLRVHGRATVPPFSAVLGFMMLREKEMGYEYIFSAVMRRL